MSVWTKVSEAVVHTLERQPYVIAGVLVVLAITGGVWLLRYWRRPNAEEMERDRRLHLNAIGRIMGGEILEMMPAPVEEPAGLPPLLVFQYHVAGVTYQVSQALHMVPVQLDPESWIPGWPVQVKYDPANPGNSIVVCEHWSGLVKRPRPTASAGEAAARPAGGAV